MSDLNTTQKAVADDHDIPLEYATLLRVTLPKFGDVPVGDLMPALREVVAAVAHTMDFGWDPTSVYEGADDHDVPFQSFILVCQETDAPRIVKYFAQADKRNRVELLG